MNKTVETSRGADTTRGQAIRRLNVREEFQKEGKFSRGCLNTTPHLRGSRVERKIGRQVRYVQRQVRQMRYDQRQTRTPMRTEPLTCVDSEETETVIEETEPKWVVTVQHHTEGPIIQGKISQKPVEFLDTGAMVNLISRDALQRVGPRVKLVEPIPFSLQGVTGNKLNTIGETRLTITLGEDINITIPVVIVEESVFPGDILTGYITMSVENITVSPAEGEAQISNAFLPFLNPCIYAEPEATVPLLKSEDREKVNNVAERSEEECRDEQFMKTPQEREPEIKQDSQTRSKREIRVDTPDEALKIASGHVIECALLRSMSISKVKLELKGVKKDVEVISLPETSRVRGIKVDSAAYQTERGRLEILVTSTLNKDITLEKGTQIGLFHVCEHPIKIVNNSQENSEDTERDVQCRKTWVWEGNSGTISNPLVDLT